jgi:hypothetical protein
MPAVNGRLSLVLLTLNLITAVVPSPARSHELSSSSGQAVAQAARLRAKLLTTDVVRLNNQYLVATGSQKLRLEQDLLATAATRRQVLASLIEADAGAVLALALPAAVRARFPSSASAYLEQEATLEGTLEILHEDWPVGGRYHYFLKSSRGRHSLHFAEHQPDHLLTGATIRVSGIQLGGTLALGGSTAVQQLVPATLPNTFGEQRTLVILVNFQDNPIEAYTVADVQSVVFDATSRFFFENSYQQSWLSGDVVGWYTIALSSTGCDSSTLAAQAQAAASSAGVDLMAYSHHLYVFPQNASCGWAGLSSVGGNPSQSWINGSLQLRIVAHELGHGLGLWHSHAMDCGAVVLANSCGISEYGDVVDTMGGPIGVRFAAHFNPFQKERLGWLNSGASPPITTVTTSGTYTLEAYEVTSSAPKALKILKSTDPTTGAKTWYYLEARRAVGSDDFLDDWYLTTNVLNGVLIRTGSDSGGNTSNMLDLTPATDSWWDAALVVGQSFTDPNTGMTITTDAVSATGAAVTVRFEETGGASSSPPAVVVSTDQSTYTRNQSVSITAKVTAGSSPVASAAVKFTVTKSNGVVITGSVTTGSNGIGVYTLRLKKQDPVGTYRADVVATENALSASATTSFTVQ